MSRLLEIKKLMKLNEVRRIEETEILVGSFNFSTGNVDRYKFKVSYIAKVPYGSHAYDDDFANHVVNAYGVVTYESGNSYKRWYKLTYTDDIELKKLAEPIKNGTKASFDDLRMY